MDRFQYFGPRDTRSAPDGDDRFVGIDMTREKPLVQPGFLSLGENTRLRTGQARQRPGTDIPGDFNPAGGFQNFLVGSGVYRNPNSEEVLLVAPALLTYVMALQDGKDPYQIDYATTVPGGETNGDRLVEFVQAFDEVLLLRLYVGVGAQNLVWTGVRGTTNAEKWQVTTLGPEGSTLVPWVPNGEPFMDRVIFYAANFPTVPARDEWIMSDIEDYTSYDAGYQRFRTNSSESDYITRIMAYFKGSVIIFKNQSIHMVSLVSVFPVSVEQRILSMRIGSVGNKMPLMVGGDIIFLNEPNGFFRISEVIENNITALPTPISEPIQKVIERINWPITKIWGCSAALDNYALFGVALDNGTAPSFAITGGRLNAILVYDTQNRNWVSAGDTWRDPTFGFNALHVTNHKGVRRLFAVDYDHAIVYLLYEGVEDSLKNGIFTVPYKIETRGYTGADPIGFKRFGIANVVVSTYDPLINITAISDGVNEEKLLTQTPLTKDRSKFYVHGHKDFDPALDDPTEPYREDYSIENISNFAGEDFEELPEGPIAFLPGSLLPVAGNKQQSIEPFLVRNNARWNALRIENDSGVCDLLAVEMTSRPISTTVRTKV